MGADVPKIGDEVRRVTYASLCELVVCRRSLSHDDNPPDGGSWELLCVYCPRNEHLRYADYTSASGSEAGDAEAASATFNPFAGLKGLLKRGD